MLVLFEILQAVTNDKMNINKTNFYFNYDLYILLQELSMLGSCCLASTSSSVEGSRNNLADGDDSGHPQMFHSLCYM